jgi:CRP-like cAMP-binding protein
VLARRLRRLSEHTEDALFLPLPSRMAKTLIALAASYGHEGDSPVDIRLAQQDLGDMVGTSRESVNKQLRAWEQDGLVTLKRERVTLNDLDALRLIAGFPGL